MSSANVLGLLRPLNRRLVVAHEPLLDIARKGTPEQLRKAVRDHLSRNEEHMLEAISGLV